MTSRVILIVVHISLTLVCLSLTRVQYLFTGVFRMQIDRNLDPPF